MIYRMTNITIVIILAYFRQFQNGYLIPLLQIIYNFIQFFYKYSTVFTYNKLVFEFSLLTKSIELIFFGYFLIIEIESNISPGDIDIIFIFLTGFFIYIYFKVKLIKKHFEFLKFQPRLSMDEYKICEYFYYIINLSVNYSNSESFNNLIYLIKIHRKICTKSNCTCGETIDFIGSNIAISGSINEKNKNEDKETLRMICCFITILLKDTTERFPNNRFLINCDLYYTLNIGKNNWFAQKINQAFLYDSNYENSLNYSHFFYQLETDFKKDKKVDKTTEHNFECDIFYKVILETQNIYEKIYEYINDLLIIITFYRKKFNSEKMIGSAFIRLLKIQKKIMKLYVNIKKYKNKTFLKSIVLFFKLNRKTAANIEQELKNYQEIKKIENDSVNKTFKFHKYVFFRTSINTHQLGTVISVSKNIKEVLGYKDKNVIGLNLNTLLIPCVAEKHDQYLFNFLKKGDSEHLGNSFVSFMVMKNGFIKPLRAILKPSFNIHKTGFEFFAFAIFPDEYKDKGLILIDSNTDEIVGINEQFYLSTGFSPYFSRQFNQSYYLSTINNVFPKLNAVEDKDQSISKKESLKSTKIDFNFILILANRAEYFSNIVNEKKLNIYNKYLSDLLKIIPAHRMVDVKLSVVKKFNYKLDVSVTLYSFKILSQRLNQNINDEMTVYKTTMVKNKQIIDVKESDLIDENENVNRNSSRSSSGIKNKESFISEFEKIRIQFLIFFQKIKFIFSINVVMLVILVLMCILIVVIQLILKLNTNSTRIDVIDQFKLIVDIRQTISLMKLEILLVSLLRDNPSTTNANNWIQYIYQNKINAYNDQLISLNKNDFMGTHTSFFYDTYNSVSRNFNTVSNTKNVSMYINLGNYLKYFFLIKVPNTFDLNSSLKNEQIESLSYFSQNIENEGLLYNESLNHFEKNVKDSNIDVASFENIIVLVLIGLLFIIPISTIFLLNLIFGYLKSSISKISEIKPIVFKSFENQLNINKLQLPESINQYDLGHSFDKIEIEKLIILFKTYEKSSLLDNFRINPKNEINKNTKRFPLLSNLASIIIKNLWIIVSLIMITLMIVITNILISSNNNFSLESRLFFENKYVCKEEFLNGPIGTIEMINLFSGFSTNIEWYNNLPRYQSCMVSSNYIFNNNFFNTFTSNYYSSYQSLLSFIDCSLEANRISFYNYCAKLFSKGIGIGIQVYKQYLLNTINNIKIGRSAKEILESDDFKALQYSAKQISFNLNLNLTDLYNDIKLTMNVFIIVQILSIIIIELILIAILTVGFVKNKRKLELHRESIDLFLNSYD